MRLSLIMVAAFLVTASPTYAETADQTGKQGEQKQEAQKNYLYQWTDEKGVFHISDSLDKVPKKFRENAKKLESAPGSAGGQRRPADITAPSDYSEEEREADRKEEWQQRMKSAKQKLANAEQHYTELQQKRDQLLRSWGGPASGHLEGREEADRINQEMKQVQEEINDARNQVEVVIPDEARRAGVPPGWLRE